MFGQTIRQLKETINFQGKDVLIKKCEDFNQIRNKLSHDLTKQTSINEINEKLQKVKNLFDEIYDLFTVAHDWFFLCFKDFKKDKFIDFT
jgi:hypothetical protein